MYKSIADMRTIEPQQPSPSDNGMLAPSSAGTSSRARFGLGSEPQRADSATAESHRSAVHRDESGGSSDEGGVESVESDSEEDLRNKAAAGALRRAAQVTTDVALPR